MSSTQASQGHRLYRYSPMMWIPSLLPSPKRYVDDVSVGETVGSERESVCIADVDCVEQRELAQVAMWLTQDTLGMSGPPTACLLPPLESAADHDRRKDIMVGDNPATCRQTTARLSQQLAKPCEQPPAVQVVEVERAHSLPVPEPRVNDGSPPLVDPTMDPSPSETQAPQCTPLSPLDSGGGLELPQSVRHNGGG